MHLNIWLVTDTKTKREFCIHAETWPVAVRKVTEKGGELAHACDWPIVHPATYDELKRQRDGSPLPAKQRGILFVLRAGAIIDGKLVEWILPTSMSGRDAGITTMRSS